jgi:2-succinyl-5-enolpyruvyl-6-hydroxy-3-cyclohexene-1-carboxylate synthase
MIVPQNPTYAYVGAFVDELARAGVRDVVICPGSRSTPLTLTFAAEERIRKWVLVDERSAAFFALGIAKRSGVPVALVCTSGTAAANFYPAICEAKASRVPLLVLTADRPPELQEVGAPQTMGQKYLYGEHVKWFTEMPLPEATDTLLRYARFTANRAVATAEVVPAGPVHLNFPFREPLSNNSILGQSLPGVSYNKELWEGRRNRYTHIDTEIFTGLDLSYSTVGFEQLERGLIIVGNEKSNFSYADFHAIFNLARYMKYPVLVDPRSQMRFFNNHNHPENDQLWIENYDVFLRDPNFVQKAKPEFVIRIGTMPISKPLLTYLQSNPDCKIWIIDDGRGWLDPTLSAEEIFHADIPTVLNGFKGGLEGLETPMREQSDWLRLWQETSKATRRVVQEEMKKFEDLFEGRVFVEIESLAPLPSRPLDSDTMLNLVVGNSMPIRDCETFFPLTPKKIMIFANRGVNGIDGQISTALGIASLNEEGQMRWQGPTVLVVGDLTFYHDLNGLLAAKKYGLNLTIVVINNDGGGIFSFLPQAEHHPDHFEDYFGTPTGLDFRLVTEMYGGTFTRIENWDDFRAAVTTGITEGGLHVVEVPTNRERNVEMHRHLWKKVSEALATVNESDDSERK